MNYELSVIQLFIIESHVNQYVKERLFKLKIKSYFLCNFQFSTIF